MKNRFKKMEKIAVVAMEGVFPKAANTTDFITNIIEKKNSIAPVPENRWIYPPEKFVNRVSMPDRAICNKAGFIDDFEFDSTGFLIDKDILSALDPVHQLVLHAARTAFLRCSHTLEQRKRTGVILASIALPTQASSRFSSQVVFQKDLSSLGSIDISRTGVVSYPASILARAMGFEGGCFTLDAACASSLFSIKLACEQLSLKKADIMVAGGVSKPNSLYTQIGFTQLQALSPTGVCSPFDAKADGLIVGEGTGIVILKRLGDAIADKDTIHAVITACGVSNDIDGTLVGPASEGQVRAMTRAYQQAGWTPDNIDYMECHGSGTPVGDQVELTSIKTLLDSYECPQKSLPIGSVKSMIGHLLTAAGAAGFIKTVLSMNQSILPPSLNFSLPSKKSVMNHSNIHVQTQAQEWKTDKPGQTRKAAVSAFGFGGINAHLLVEAYRPGEKIYPSSLTREQKKFECHPCAIIGMGVHAKNCDSLPEFENLFTGKQKVSKQLPNTRWKVNTSRLDQTPGVYLDQVEIGLGQFHIPPKQMGDILPQQMSLLKAVHTALSDAGIYPRPKDSSESREHVGCAIGIDFDYGATDFHLRWQHDVLDDSLKDKISPPLTFNRTLGSLGGIVASRVAKEFKLGGPCFTLSAGENSGIKAIETAMSSLSSSETDIFICGAVDLAGDLRQSIRKQLLSRDNGRSFNSEGSAALVLKRYDQAIDDGDAIYAVIPGTGGGSGNPIPGERQTILDEPDKFHERYIQSVKTALKESEIQIEQVGLFETGSAAASQISDLEKKSLKKLRAQNKTSLQLKTGSVSSIFGDCGAVTSLFSIIKTALSICHHLRPTADFSSDFETWQSTNHDRIACVSSITTDGTVGHLMLKEHAQTRTVLPVPEKPEQKKNTKYKETLILNTNPLPLSDNDIDQINSARCNQDVQFKKSPECIQEECYENATKIKVSENLSFSQGIDPLLISQGSRATAQAHEKFLEFSSQNMQQYEKQFSLLTQMANGARSGPVHKKEAQTNQRQPFLDRAQCLEYAIGKAGNVLGREFDIIDTYPVRVRLPAEPLMLVDRIMEIQGEMLSLGPGKIVTQHDVLENAWYLDGPKAPVSISIEAGQADLFLCAWLGIDHAVKGKRKYRLLDARVTFHRPLPCAGETIEYHIEIDRFLKQGDVYLFFFHYEGYIDDQLLISMRDGCAGFFTELEVEKSGGIVLTAEDKQECISTDKFMPFVDVQNQALSDAQVQSLRSGDLQAAFGDLFAGKQLGKNLCLPGGKMHLIDRVLELNPSGGRYGLGAIIAQSDIHPEDWFLTCHFIDDMVMPGTLMYECCAHALRIFTQRIGWITDSDDVFYDVMINNESDLKCRGPVTQQTRHARYEIEIKQIGYNPEPYVIADAHMFSDDLRIVLYKNMGLKLVGISRQDLKDFWK